MLTLRNGISIDLFFSPLPPILSVLSVPAHLAKGGARASFYFILVIVAVWQFRESITEIYVQVDINGPKVT